MNNLLTEIIDCLSTNKKPMKAREIGSWLGVDKTLVNYQLYSHPELFSCNDYCWVLKNKTNLGKVKNNIISKDELTPISGALTVEDIIGNEKLDKRIAEMILNKINEITST